MGRAVRSLVGKAPCQNGTEGETGTETAAPGEVPAETETEKPRESNKVELTPDQILSLTRQWAKKVWAKASVVARCHLMTLIPSDCFDEDRCDAIAVQDWAANTFGQRAASIKELYFVGERPR